MGHYKELMMEQDSFHYSYHGETLYACSDCFNDYAIRQFIEENAAHASCSFCERESDGPIAADFEEVLKFIMVGIMTEWGTTDDELLQYDSETGTYVGVEPYYATELIEEVLEPVIENMALLQAVREAVDDSLWCPKDAYMLRPEQALLFNWQEFSKQVKHKTRYVFFRLNADLSSPYGEDPDDIPFPQMLDRLGRIIAEEPGLVRTLNIDDIIWRSRPHNRAVICNNVRSMGPPSENDCLSSNRMSPAGIPMFYGALDEITPLKEIFHNPGDYEVATVSSWKLLKSLRFLDLTNLPSVPSLFDPERREHRSNIKFLRAFVQEISQSVILDRREHIDYVPTQVFTEYIRHIYEDEDSNKFDGIMYPSVKNVGHTNCVIFCNQDNCCNEPYVATNPRDESKYLKLINFRDLPYNSIT